MQICKELAAMTGAEQAGLGRTWAIPPEPGSATAGPGTVERMVRRMLRGDFPEVCVRPDLDPFLWYESYIQTCLERDVRQMRNVGDLRDFRRFMVALAARAGQLLNLSDVARKLGVAVNTARAWLSVLEASRHVAIVPPFSRKLTKRLVKAPKVYFSDTGLLCHLLGLRDPDAVLGSAIGGPVFENLVFTEIVRSFRCRGLAPDLTFFRSSDGLEVDFLVGHAGRLHPIEVKRSATPRREMADGIERLRKLLPDDLAPGFVVLLGDQARFPLTRDCDAIGFEGIGSGGEGRLGLQGLGAAEAD